MSETPVLSLSDLRAAGRQPVVPFRIALPDGGNLEFRTLLRLLPGKRLAGQALWQGQAVFAKVFIADGARRHGERERDGLAALTAKGLPTPAVLLAQPLGTDGYLVLSEFVTAASALDELLLSPEQPGILLEAMALLGRLHRAGLIHPDLHLGNFLQHDGHLLLIDGDGVQETKSSAELDANLALFLSQLSPPWDALRADLLQAYGRDAGGRDLQSEVTAARAKRLRHYLSKIFRNCTKFSVDRSSRHFSVVLRAGAEGLRALLADPDAAVANGEILKDGGTCTVAQAEAAGRKLVIKRYNLKGWGHALSRAMRPSRAWHAWQSGHRLAFFGISTPEPLAMLEERLGPMRRRAFLVNAYCPGISLRDCLDADSLPDAVQQAAIVRLFGSLCDLRITHGDLKATNLLWHEADVVLIDLDAMVHHRSAGGFARAWRRDRARLLRNWPVGSVLWNWLDDNLPPA